MTDTKLPDFEELVKSASNSFYKHFKQEPLLCGCAPGRVNLIGEHTDYNNGFVLPMALPLVTVVIGRKNFTRKCNIITCCTFVDEPKEAEILLADDELGKAILPGKPLWANYVKGVLANYKGKLEGFNAVIATTVPVGGGLSSSAALEVATYTFLDALTENTSSLSLTDKALACQKAEHEFSGTPCGIMDQFISFMGKKDHVVLIDCRSLESKLICMKNAEIAILITNTNVHHKLAESQYSKRKMQCETATKIISKPSLRDVTLSELQDYKEELRDVIYRRALHVVSEIQRTTEAAEALKQENYEVFGHLMNQSHESLRDNYEVSCPELDVVVNAALEIDGVFGSRMTGGGFGGCTVTLLKTNAINATVKNIKEKYAMTPTFYVCHPGDGAKMFKLPLC